MAARAGFEATGGGTRAGWEVRDGVGTARSSSAPACARRRLLSAAVKARRRGWVGLVDCCAPCEGTRRKVYHRRAFGLEAFKGGVPGFCLNPTLAPRLAVALPGCRSIGPVHPVSPLQKLIVSQSRPVRGEFSDRSLAHGGKDGLKGFVVNSEAGE